MPIYYEQDQAKKLEIMKKFQTEHLPPLLKYLEALYVKNGTKYFASNEVIKIS